MPLDVAAAGPEILVVGTKTPPANMDGKYAARRALWVAACAELGIGLLREVIGPAAALTRLPEFEGRHVRHVVTENARVQGTVAALSVGDFAEVGRLMTASHASMRDDYEITAPNVDLAVETMLADAEAAAVARAGYLAPAGFTARRRASATPSDTDKISKPEGELDHQQRGVTVPMSERGLFLSTETMRSAESIP